MPDWISIPLNVYTRPNSREYERERGREHENASARVQPSHE